MPWFGWNWEWLQLASRVAVLVLCLLASEALMNIVFHNTLRPGHTNSVRTR